MCGLVSRISLTERRENLDQLGFVNAEVSSRYSHFTRPPSPKPTVLGFLLSADTPQSGLANGPTWAALKKHRTPRKGKPKRLGALQGACVVGRTAEFTNEPSKAEVGWQGRASGISQPLKSSGFDEVFLVSGSLNNLKAGEGSANPCIRRSMGKQKAQIAKLKMRYAKIGQIASLSAKSANEIAADLLQSGDDFLRSSAWKALRKSVLQHYGAKCMCCGYASDKRGKINVDHIKPRKFFPELALEFDNLQVLCARCNKDKGNKHMTDYRYAQAVAVERFAK